MAVRLTADIQSQWSTVGPLLTIRNEREYDRAVKLLNELLDEIGTNQRHPLYSFMDTLNRIAKIMQ